MKFKYGMLLPMITVLLVAVGYPIGYSVWMSFTNYQLISRNVDYIGLDNYVNVIGNPDYWSALGVTAAYVVTAVTVELVLGLTLALILQKQKWVRDITRSMLLAPMFITPIAVGLMFRFLLNDQLGAIPEMLRFFGISYDFLGPGRALFTLALIDAWQWTPFMLLLLLAGLESLPQQPFEAARVDGAKPWYTFRRITLPLLAPILTVAILMRGLDATKVFEYVFATTRGGPGIETQTIQYFTYQTGVQFFRLGEASAMAFILLILVMTIIVLLFRRLERVK